MSDERQPSAHPHRWLMLGGAWLLYVSFGLTFTALAPLVHRLTDELALSHSAMGSVLGSWHLVYIVSAVPLGAILDRIGLRRAMFAAALIMSASGLSRAYAFDYPSLFLATAAFGLGGPLISVGGPKLIGLWFDERERGFAMGIYLTGPALGAIAALSLTNGVVMPLTGGSWRTVFVVYGLFTLAAGLAWLVVSRHPASRAVERRQADEPKSPQFAAVGEMVRLRTVQLILVMSVGIFFINTALDSWLPEILRSGGIDPVSAGLWASVPTLVSIASLVVLPRWIAPSRRLAALPVLFLAAGVAAILVGGPAGPGLAVGLVLQGMARGGIRPLSILVLTERREVGSRRTGAAGGLYFAAGEIGGVLGPLAMGLLFDVTGEYRTSLFLLAGLCAGLVAVVLCLRRLGG